jgi:HSP20 family molecular chaperone IbpA
MKDQTATGLVGGLEISKLAPGDPFLAEEIEGLVARRAYELFEARGCAHGFDREDWRRAQSEIVVNIPVDVIDTETEIVVCADVPGLSGNNLDVRVAPRAVCITRKRQVASNQEGKQTVYSERRSDLVFRVLDLPSEIDPDSAGATLENGMLEIKLLKVGTGKGIPVRARAASA